MVNQKTYVETKRAVSINMMDPVVTFYFDLELEIALFSLNPCLSHALLAVVNPLDVPLWWAMSCYGCMVKKHWKFECFKAFSLSLRWHISHISPAALHAHWHVGIVRVLWDASIVFCVSLSTHKLVGVVLRNDVGNPRKGMDL